MVIIHALQTWWHQQSWIELTGVFTGFLCVILAAINNIWNWPVAIISVTLYIFIFYNARLYADMGLQFYFLAMNIYGWYFWGKKPKAGDKKAEDKTPVAIITKKETLAALAIVALVTPLLGFSLIKLSPVLHYQPAAYPYLDSFCTACSLVAQVFLARKILENWLIWIFVDIIYVGVYFVKGLQPTAVMYAGYIVSAWLGYVDWKKDYKKQVG